MSLIDNIRSDFDDIFLDTDEFATEHTLKIGNDEIKLFCIWDDERITERSDKAAEGTYLGERLLFLKASELPGRPAPGAKVSLDGKSIGKIVHCVENIGVYEIRLGANYA